VFFTTFSLADKWYTNNGAVGEYIYVSRITEVEEKLPICVNIIGPPGESVLIRKIWIEVLTLVGSEGWAPQFLNELLVFSGRATSVLTGKHTFEPVYRPNSYPT
jgi:hypothetical protein